MPENTKEEKAEKEIAECNYCINSLCHTMSQMKIPQNKWEANPMVQTYLERINKARLILNK